MSKHFRKICQAENFPEICKIIESRNLNSHYKDIVFTDSDYANLKELVQSVTIRLLNSEEKIPSALITLSAMLGEECGASVRSIISNFIVSRRSTDISQFIQQNFQNIGSLKTIFGFLEQTVDTVSNLYENLPASWNVELELVTRSVIMIKQVVCEHFFTNEVDPECYSAGLIHTVNFEMKLEGFFTNKMCCGSAVALENDGGDAAHGTAPDCIHKRMLSRVFLPYIDVFFEHYLTRKLDGGSFQQNTVEKNIIKGYIDFFKQLEYVYSIASYVDDREAYTQLVMITDRTLFTMIRKTRVEDAQPRMIVLISTILYVQHVLEEFVNNVSLKQQMEFKLVSMEAARKLERLQAIKLERDFNNNFSGKILDLSNAYENLFRGHFLISDEVRYYILELCMSQLFSKICMMKMNAEVSAQVESEMKMLEHTLGPRFGTIPYFGLIVDYVKIFNFPVEPREEFIRNFNVLSANRFEFTQILRAFEDQKLAFRMYEAYRKSNK